MLIFPSTLSASFKYPSKINTHYPLRVYTAMNVKFSFDGNHKTGRLFYEMISICQRIRPAPSEAIHFHHWL